MKTLRYKISGIPHNREDCLDYASKQVPSSVTIHLSNPVRTVEDDVLTGFDASFFWDFRNFKVSYRETIHDESSCFDSLPDRESAYLRANVKLNNLIVGLAGICPRVRVEGRFVLPWAGLE
jgi:hypothetical protein